MPRANTLLISALVSLSLVNRSNADAGSIWQRYKSEFIQDDGRVIDYYQEHSSHSEGQGYAMNFAVIFNDREMFEKLWRWTKNNIGVRRDGLFAWRWGRQSDREWTALDKNNATDGDILIAYALLKADEKWSVPDHKKSALEILKNIRQNLKASWQGHEFLLPGRKGFKKHGGYVINPSYMIFPAMEYFTKAEERSFWKRVCRGSRSLLKKAYFGPMSLPADWVFLSDSGVEIYHDHEPVFGASAIRVLLYTALEKTPRLGSGAKEMLDLYGRIGYFPAWVNLKDNSYCARPASAGFYAVYGLVAQRLNKTELSGKIFAEAAEKLKGERREYYSMSLYLLATGPKNYWD